MKWFRLYDELLDDPKIQELPVEIRWRWLEFMCVASRQEIRGSLPSVSRLSFHFRCSENEAERRIEALKNAGFIDVTKDGYRIHGWDDRQFKSDDISARAAKSKNKRNVGGNVPKNVLRNNHGNVSGNNGMPIPENVSGNPPETETETETENFSSSKDSEKFKKTTTPQPPSGGNVVVSSSSEIEPPEYPDPLTTIITVQSGDHEIPDTEARKIWGHIWRQWKNPKLCFGFYEMQRWVSVKGWLHTIETAVRQGSRPSSIKFLQKIGMDFDINGPKREKPLRKGDVGSVAYVPTYEHQGPVTDISEHVLEAERLTRLMMKKGMIQ